MSACRLKATSMHAAQNGDWCRYAFGFLAKGPLDVRTVLHAGHLAFRFAYKYKESPDKSSRRPHMAFHCGAASVMKHSNGLYTAHSERAQSTRTHPVRQANQPHCAQAIADMALDFSDSDKRLGRANIVHAFCVWSLLKTAASPGAGMCCAWPRGVAFVVCRSQGKRRQ